MTTFSKAPLKRYTDFVADVPGPGAYGLLKSPDQNWKKGVMGIEQSERFREGREGPDTFGLYNPTLEGKENKRPRPSTSANIPNPERAKQHMEDVKHRLQQTHEKELARVQAKLAKTEQSRQELAKEKNDVKTELTALKLELKTLTNRESHLKSQLEKSEASLQKHSTALPLLQKKLEELSKSHSDSRARKEAEISSLKAEITAVKSSLGEKEVELKRAKEVERELKHEVEGVREVERECWKVIEELKREKKQEKEQLEELNRQSQRLVWKLERQVGDRDAMIEALTEYSTGLEDELLLANEELEEKDKALEWALGELRYERQSGNSRSEKEWRQRTRSDGREIAWLKEELAVQVEVGRVGMECEKVGRENDDLKRTDAVDDAERLGKELEIVEAELDLAVNGEIPRLEDEIEELEARIDALEEDVADQKEITERFEEENVELREEGQKMKGEMEEISRKVGEREKELEKERMEKKRLVGLLGQTRAAEAGLKEELDAVLVERDQLQSVQDQHSDLERHIDELARRNALAESDVRALGELNTDLLGHNNMNQKIRHVAAIRADLVESRRAHLATTSQLATMQRENDALRAELDSYRSVSAFPSSSSTRSRVVRPKLDDIYNFDENEEDQEYQAEETAEEEEGEMLPPPLPPFGARKGMKVSLMGLRAEPDVFGASGSRGGVSQTSVRRAGRVPVASKESAAGPRSVKMQGPMNIAELF